MQWFIDITMLGYSQNEITKEHYNIKATACNIIAILKKEK